MLSLSQINRLIIRGGNHFGLGMTVEGGHLLRIFPSWNLIQIPDVEQLRYLLHRKIFAQYSALFMAHFNFLVEIDIVMQNVTNQDDRGKCTKCVLNS